MCIYKYIYAVQPDKMKAVTFAFHSEFPLLDDITICLHPMYIVMPMLMLVTLADCMAFQQGQA